MTFNDRCGHSYFFLNLRIHDVSILTLLCVFERLRDFLTFRFSELFTSLNDYHHEKDIMFLIYIKQKMNKFLAAIFSYYAIN